MSKSKSAFFCNNCGYESAKWAGKCPACNEWNTFTEELIDSGKEKESGWEGYTNQQKGMEVIAIDEVNRKSTKKCGKSDGFRNDFRDGFVFVGKFRLSECFRPRFHRICSE